MRRCLRVGGEGLPSGGGRPLRGVGAASVPRCWWFMALAGSFLVALKGSVRKLRRPHSEQTDPPVCITSNSQARCVAVGPAPRARACSNFLLSRTQSPRGRLIAKRSFNPCTLLVGNEPPPNSVASLVPKKNALDRSVSAESKDRSSLLEDCSTLACANVDFFCKLVQHSVVVHAGFPSTVFAASNNCYGSFYVTATFVA